MNTEEWFQYLLEHNKIDKEYNMETVIFLLDEILSMSPSDFNGCKTLNYFKVRKIAEEANKILKGLPI